MVRTKPCSPGRGSHGWWPGCSRDIGGTCLSQDLHPPPSSRPLSMAQLVLGCSPQHSHAVPSQGCAERGHGVKTESWHCHGGWQASLPEMCQADGHLTHSGQMKSVNHFTAALPSTWSREERLEDLQQSFLSAGETMLTPVLGDATCSLARDTGTSSCTKTGGFPTADMCCHTSPNSDPSHRGARADAQLLETEPTPQRNPSVLPLQGPPQLMAKDTTTNGMCLQRVPGQKPSAEGHAAYFVSARPKEVRAHHVCHDITWHITHGPGYRTGCAHGVYVPLRNVWPINARIFPHGTKNIYSGRVWMLVAKGNKYRFHFIVNTLSRAKCSFLISLPAI